MEVEDSPLNLVSIHWCGNNKLTFQLLVASRRLKLAGLASIVVDNRLMLSTGELKARQARAVFCNRRTKPGPN